ncbi:MAG: hypothetical protein ACRCZF_07860, partial [Gemmataceae bacterium]
MTLREPNLAVLTGSADPPGDSHREVAEHLARLYGAAVIVPCSLITEAPSELHSWHRATMADLTFRGLERVHVELGELETGNLFDFAALDEHF